jgi:hypothetical protein
MLDAWNPIPCPFLLFEDGGEDKTAPNGREVPKILFLYKADIVMYTNLVIKRSIDSPTAKVHLKKNESSTNFLSLEG